MFVEVTSLVKLIILNNLIIPDYIRFSLSAWSNKKLIANSKFLSQAK